MNLKKNWKIKIIGNIEVANFDDQFWKEFKVELFKVEWRDLEKYGQIKK